MGQVQDGRDQRHIREQWRILTIFCKRGYTAAVEYPYPAVVEGFQRKKQFRADVRAVGWGREICAEVDGYKGHKTTQAFHKARNKYRSIRDNYGQHIEAFAFTFGQLAHWTDEEISEEMKLGRSKYRTSEDVALQILEYLYEHGPARYSRLIYVGESTHVQWKKLSADMFLHGLIAKRPSKTRRDTYDVMITQAGKEYVDRTHQYHEEIAEIKNRERTLRKGAYDHTKDVNLQH